jgi:DNA repair protein RadD
MLGPINDPIIKKPGKKKGGEAPLKTCPACGCLAHIRVPVCKGDLEDGTPCNHKFEFAHKIKLEASSFRLLKTGKPDIRTVEVTFVSFREHEKGDKKSLEVIYYCGINRYREFICFEHRGYPLHLAHNWWRLWTGNNNYPITTKDAIARLTNVRIPKCIEVDINDRYLKIVGHKFDILH